MGEGSEEEDFARPGEDDEEDADAPLGSPAKSNYSKVKSQRDGSNKRSSVRDGSLKGSIVRDGSLKGSLANDLSAKKSKTLTKGGKRRLTEAEKLQKTKDKNLENIFKFYGRQHLRRDITFD